VANLVVTSASTGASTLHCLLFAISPSSWDFAGNLLPCGALIACASASASVASVASAGANAGAGADASASARARASTLGSAVGLGAGNVGGNLLSDRGMVILRLVGGA